VTLNELVSGAFIAAGEPPDWEYRDPLSLLPDLANANWARLVSLVNEAQDSIVMWVHQDGRRMRLRLSEDIGRLRALRQTATIASVVGSTLTLTTDSGAHDSYRGQLVQSAAGALALVFSSYTSGTGDVLALSEVSGTFVATDVVTFSKREYYFANMALLTPPFADGSIYADYRLGTPLEIVGVYGIDGRELDLAKESEKSVVIAPNAGQPGAYTKSARGLRFDSYPDLAYEYLVRFQRLPRPFSTVDGTLDSELPAQFHRAIILYVLWWLLLNAQEVDKAYAVRRNFEDMLKRTQTELDLQDRSQRGQISLDVLG